MTEDLPAPIALGGFRYSGPKLNFTAAAGLAHGRATYLGSLSWDVTARFKMIGSLTDMITTGAGSLLNNLATLASSAEGVFSNTQSYYWQSAAQALNPQFANTSLVPLTGLSLDNSINHERQARLSFSETYDRTSLSLSFFGTVRDRLNVVAADIPTRSTAYGTQFTSESQVASRSDGVCWGILHVV